jgi:hypothetical protein
MGNIVAYTKYPNEGYFGDEPKEKLIHKYRIVDDKVEEIHNVVVYEFSIGDVEDPILYVAEPLCNWEKTEQGIWVKEHALETPTWHSYIDHLSMGTKFCIRAKLSAKDYTFFLLKWKSK